MRIPYSWIKEWLPIDKSPHVVAEMLTMAGLEVDAIDEINLSSDKAIAVRVLEAEKHPDADKLRVAKVTDGSNQFQIVCGASNCKPGLVTALAPIGSTLTDAENKSFKIKKGKLRGIESFGMLCSPIELGLGEDAAGIIDLGDDVPIGTDLTTHFRDWSFEISLTPNLAHCASVQGVVRELSAIADQAYTEPQNLEIQENDSPIEKDVKVNILDREKCPRYACRLVRDVKVGPSPLWLKQKLEKSGIRSINNIVDATNYILLELGHPLHAFDWDRISNGEIIVRTANEDESFTTLDGKERKLNKEMLLICDAEKPVALAGVMGGQNSEVSDSTVNILLEAAYFQPTNIRRTSKKLNLITDSSKRFERGCDPNGVPKALDAVTALIQSIAGGEAAKGRVDNCEEKFQPKEIPCRVTRINQILGIHLGVGEVESTFKRLRFEYTWDGKDTFHVKVPTYRFDVFSEIDLIEEVARIYGYDNMPHTPSRYEKSDLPHAPIFLFEREVRRQALVQGLQELLTCDLLGPQTLDVLYKPFPSEESTVKVLNPTSIEQSILRQSLLPGLLQVVKYNHDHGNHAICGFEIGKVHFKKESNYKEQLVLGFVLTGKRQPHYWDDEDRDVDFFDLKGLIENILKGLGISKATFLPSQMENFHPGQQAHIQVGDVNLGTFGQVHPGIAQALDVPQKIFFGELSLTDLYQCRKDKTQMKQIPQFPGTERDWTVTLSTTTPIGDVVKALKSKASPLLESVEVLYLYRSEKLGPNRLNATFRFVYRDKKKTISQESADKVHFALIEKVGKEFQQEPIPMNS